MLSTLHMPSTYKILVAFLALHDWYELDVAHYLDHAATI